jgi:hypothetical protein
MLIRQPAGKQFANAKLWVSEAVAIEDKMFDKPLWRGERTPDDEYDERLRRIKILRKYRNTHLQAETVANQLEHCERRTRCLSGACPECAHLLQRCSSKNRKDLFPSILTYQMPAWSRYQLFQGSQLRVLESSKRFPPPTVNAD